MSAPRLLLPLLAVVMFVPSHVSLVQPPAHSQIGVSRTLSPSDHSDGHNYTTPDHAAPGKVTTVAPPAAVLGKSGTHSRADEALTYRLVGTAIFPSRQDTTGTITSMTVHLRNQPDGTTSAVVKWQPSSHSPGGHKTAYLIGWGMIRCNVDPKMPQCDLTEDRASLQLHHQRDQEMQQVVIHQLVYNAKYWLQVGVPGVPAHSTVFYTPRCPQVDRAFTRCTASANGRQVTAPPAAAPPAGSGANETSAGNSKDDSAPHPGGSLLTAQGLPYVLGVCVTAVLLGVAVLVIECSWHHLSRKDSKYGSLSSLVRMSGGSSSSFRPHRHAVRVPPPSHPALLAAARSNLLQRLNASHCPTPLAAENATNMTSDFRPQLMYSPGGGTHLSGMDVDFGGSMVSCVDYVCPLDCVCNSQQPLQPLVSSPTGHCGTTTGNDVACWADPKRGSGIREDFLDELDDCDDVMPWGQRADMSLRFVFDDVDDLQNVSVCTV